jgi:hypothetical protein
MRAAFAIVLGIGLVGCSDDGNSGANAGSGAQAGSAGSSGSAGSGGNGGSAGSSGSGGSSGGGCAADVCPAPGGGLDWECKHRFAYGINYAWHHFAADFGGISTWNQLGTAGAYADHDASFAEMRAHGVSVVRWWVFPEFRGEGVALDAAETPTGLGATVMADLDAALELADKHDVYLMLTLFSFDNFRPTRIEAGIEIPGLSPIALDATKRKALLDDVVRPFAAHVETSPRKKRVIAWDVINEPEWAIEPSGQNDQDFDPNPELAPVSLADMKALISEAAAVLEQQTPHAFTSVGWAAAKWAWAFDDVALDVNQPHIYGWVNEFWPYTQTPAELGYPARPTIMGELYLESMPFADGGSDATLGAILESWFTNGYAGAWPWQHFDKAANLPLLKTFADAKGCQAAF